MGFVRSNLLFAVLSLMGAFAFAEPSPAPNLSVRANEDLKLRDIRELFKVQKKDQVVAQLYKQLYGEQEDSAQKNRKQSQLLEELTEMLLPVYDRNFTHAEIQAYLQFYQSPAGQRLLEKEPEMIEESSRVIHQWMDKVSAEVDGHSDRPKKAKKRVRK